MATRPLPDRHDDQPAFVLHAYPYKETSLIVETFVREFGRVGMVAKGAKRPRSELRGLLQAFLPISLSWGGATELKTLVKAEWRGGVPLPGRSRTAVGVLPQRARAEAARARRPASGALGRLPGGDRLARRRIVRGRAGDGVAALRGPTARGARLCVAAHARGGRRRPDRSGRTLPLRVRSRAAQIRFRARHPLAGGARRDAAGTRASSTIRTARPPRRRSA